MWKEKDIVSHDWLLKKIVENRDTWQTVMSGDQFYIDVDSISLHIIFSMLQKTIPVNELHNLSDRELLLVKTSAEYLSCLDIANNIQTILDTKRNEISEIRADYIFSTVNERGNLHDVKKRAGDLCLKVQNILSESAAKTNTIHSYSAVNDVIKLNTDFLMDLCTTIENLEDIAQYTEKPY
jgi:hypothetical protein